MQPESEHRATVASVLNAHPAAARVFSRRKIDFCCRGAMPLTDAAAAARVDVDELLAEIAREEAPPATVDFGAMSLAELCDYIVVRHHRPLDLELPRLRALALKVASVHGGPQHEAVRERTLAIIEDLRPHFAHEEHVLFPLVSSGDLGKVRTPLATMHEEHELLGQLLAELREATDDYTAPPHACGSWRALWDGLAALEDDIHIHIHIENNILFPRVAREARAS